MFLQTVELGGRLCIVLPALAAVGARLAQARWLVEARALRLAPRALAPPVLRTLLLRAQDLLPDRAVERERATLYKLQGC